MQALIFEEVKKNLIMHLAWAFSDEMRSRSDIDHSVFMLRMFKMMVF